MRSLILRECGVLPGLLLLLLPFTVLVFQDKGGDVGKQQNGPGH